MHKVRVVKTDHLTQPGLTHHELAI